MQRTQLENFPAIAIENRATRENWQHKRPLSRNNFVDQQHIIALPYVDSFLTDDKKLRSLIGRITAKLAVPRGSAYEESGVRQHVSMKRRCQPQIELGGISRAVEIGLNAGRQTRRNGT